MAANKAANKAADKAVQATVVTADTAQAAVAAISDAVNAAPGLDLAASPIRPATTTGLDPKLFGPSGRRRHRAETPAERQTRVIAHRAAYIARHLDVATSHLSEAEQEPIFIAAKAAAAAARKEADQQESGRAAKVRALEAGKERMSAAEIMARLNPSSLTRVR